MLSEVLRSDQKQKVAQATTGGRQQGKQVLVSY